MKEIEERPKRTERFGGNQHVPLDDASRVWIIRAGSVALFAVAPHEDEPGGRRRLLFSCREGEALFGMPGAWPRVVAVTLEPTQLEAIPREATPSRDSLDPLERAWMLHWRQGLRAPDGLMADNLEAFHASVLARLPALVDDEQRQDIHRFRDREQRAGEDRRYAVSELTSVLAAAEQGPPRGSDLFVAAYVAGRAAGVTLRPPLEGDSAASGGIEPVERIAAASHVRLRKVVLHDGWWSQDCGPLLAFRGDERAPVAVLPKTAGSYELFDPATRVRGPLDEANRSELDSQAWQIYRPLPADAARGTELIRFALQGRGKDLLLLLASGALATLLGMFTPQATALLIDGAIPNADTGLLWQLGFGLLAAALGGAVFRFSQGIAMVRVETSADTVTQSAVWDRLLNLQMSFFRRFSTGDLTSRVTAVSQIRSYLSGTTLRTLFSSVILLLNLGLLLYYSPRLTLVALTVAALSSAATIGCGMLILRYQRTIHELQGRFFGLMVQLINGVAKLRVAAAEERAFTRWARAYARLATLELKQRRVQDAMQVLNIALSGLSSILIFAIAATLLRPAGAEGGLTTGVFLAFHVAFGTFIGAIVNLSNTVTDVMAIAILRDRARPILETVPEIDDRKADPGRLTGNLALEHVAFQYREDGPVILDDVSLEAGRGQFVALVGPSGSGKSTVFRLLLGFESPQSGSVFIDGQDLAGLDVFAVRRQLGVVLQDGRINAGSLFESIACGTQVSLNDAWRAARSTGFAEEIESMPMGMHTVVSEGGTNLSGGQRQRLLLARALVHRPQVLLLDEATSALDNKTQAIVSESLSRLDVTRVVIAHRLSTVRRADKIYVIESGRVVQQGSFDELAHEPGLFARLMARQLA